MPAHIEFNNLDYLVLSIILLSGLFALMRGFVREALSLVSWGAAYYIAAQYYMLAYPYVHKSIKSDSAATLASAAVVFVGVLVVLTLISYLISRLIRGQALTAIDRSLGFIFGILRGALFVAIIYLVVQTVIWPSLEHTIPGQAPHSNTTEMTMQEAEKKDSPPQWIVQAKCFAALKQSAKLLKSMLPEKELQKLSKHYLGEKAAAQKAVEDETLRILSSPEPNGGQNSTPAQ